MTSLCKTIVKYMPRFTASGQPVNRSESDMSANIIIPRHHLLSAAVAHKFLSYREHLLGDIAAQILLLLSVWINPEG